MSISNQTSDYLAATEILSRSITPEEMRELLNDVSTSGQSAIGIEHIVAEVEGLGSGGRFEIPDADVCSFLVEIAGFDLLANQDLRYLLALRASDREIDDLHQCPGYNIGPSISTSEIAKEIAVRRWHPGRRWANHFVKILGFPESFAGITGEQSGPDFEDISPHIALPDLTDFQQDVRTQVVTLLSAMPPKNRAIISLPTGAGKTRTTVEALLDWWIDLGCTRSILWIAQSEELCEQGLQSFKEVWVDRGEQGVRELLRLYRFWGNHQAIPDESIPGVIIASIDKLRAGFETRYPEREQALVDLARRVAVVVIDEAHRAEAKSYRNVLEKIGIQFGTTSESEIPVIGLTATPLRSQDEETKRLAKRFGSFLIRPANLPADPLESLEELRRRGVLSRVQHLVLPGEQIEFTATEEEYLEHWDDLDSDLLARLGKIKDRNKRILECLLGLDQAWPTLFFACSVEHAQAMSILLRRQGRSAASVSGVTRDSTRRHLIEQFKLGKLSVLCNFGVLTTGFDAPKVQAVVVARPTKSRILYEQMIGRGMRGTVFGGTEECLVIDVADNLVHRNGKGFVPAFQQYSEYWNSKE